MNFILVLNKVCSFAQQNNMERLIIACICQLFWESMRRKKPWFQCESKLWILDQPLALKLEIGTNLYRFARKIKKKDHIHHPSTISMNNQFLRNSWNSVLKRFLRIEFLFGRRCLTVLRCLFLFLQSNESRRTAGIPENYLSWFLTLYASSIVGGSWFMVPKLTKIV